MQSIASASSMDMGSTTDEFYEPRLFQGSGRLGRVRFLLYTTAMSFLPLVLILAAVLVMASNQASIMVVALTFFAFLAGALAIVMTMILCIRRLNDLDFKGWWILAAFVPIANIFLSLALIFMPGTAGSNQHGTPSAPDSNKIKVLCALFTSIYILLLGYTNSVISAGVAVF